ncbi:MerR family transcriptional regulator [Streptomyces sp. NPDC001975]
MHALRAYRGLAGAVGPVAARQMLAALRTETIAAAASAISAVHVRLARERDEALRAQQALRAIQGETNTPEFEQESDAMTITQLAAALDVRPSTLRFWEQEELVIPERVTSLRARRYGLSAIRAARIVAALRGTGYSIPAVRDILGSLHQLDGMGKTQRILQHHLDQIAMRPWHYSERAQTGSRCHVRSGTADRPIDPGRLARFGAGRKRNAIRTGSALPAGKGRHERS